MKSLLVLLLKKIFMKIQKKILKNIKNTIEPPELPSIDELTRECSLEHSTKEKLTTL